MLGKLALRDAKFERTLELAQEGLQIGGGSANSTDTIRFLRLKGFALSDLGRHGEALAVALEALELAERSDDLNQIGQAIWLAQGEHYHLGQFGACERLIKRGIEVYEAMDQPLRAATLYNDLANLQCLANRSDEARATLEPVLANAQQEQSNVLHVLLETLADLHLWLGEFGPAATNYQLATESIARFQDIEIHRYWLKYAEARWRDGKHQEAEAVLNKSRKVIPEDAETLQGRRAFLQGFIAFDQGHLEVALAHFQDSKRSDDMTQKPRALALSAEIARRTGKLEQHHLQELFENLDSMPSDAVLNTDQVYLTELWRETQTRGWFVERISGFAAQAGLPALKLIVKPTLAKPETSITTHRVRLEIITLGKLQVRVAGQTVKLPFAKAGELLIWLALHGPSNHEQVIDALWDGSNEDKHHEYFRVAVRRLRSTLAGPLPESDTFNPLPFERGTYTLSDQLEVVLDTQQARFALENNAPDEASQALEAYRGEFLPGVDTQWVTELRTQCLENTVTLALTLGEQLEASQPREALRTYRRAVELEPLNELGHLGLIRTHLALGGLPAANQAYGTYNRMLHEEFGLEPSANLRRTLNDLGLRV